MRIAIVAGPYIPIPPPKYGGSEQVAHYLIQGLLEAGHEPILLAPGDSVVDCALMPITEKALYYPKSSKELRAHTRAVQQANRKTRKILKSLLPDIDVIHSMGYDLTPFKKFPSVTTLHNPIIFDDLPYYMKRRDLNFVSISKNQQASCPDLKYAGVVYNGENTDDFPLVTEPENYLCFLGRLEREKNPHLAIQLSISLGMKIKLAGRIDYHSEGYFENEVEPYFDHPLVEYLGELGFEEKVQLLSKAKCNLHPTNFREPFGLAVVEAAYCGTPTLAISRGSMPELIEQDRTGILVEDFVEGRHHIEKCFEMDRGYIASRARQLFNYQTMTAQYTEVYEKVIEQMPARIVRRQRLLPRILDKINRLRPQPAPSFHHKKIN